MRADEISLKKADGWLIILYLVMVSLGVVTIYSSNFSPDYPELFSFSREYGKQLLWIGVSLKAGGAILLIEGRFIRKFAYQIYLVVCLLLVAVLLVGTKKNGATAWFGIGDFGIQPSEFAKVGVSLALAKYLSTLNIRFSDFKTRFYTVLIIGVPAALIMLQPDAGTVIVFMSFILVLYREGMSGNLLLFGLFVLVISVLTLILKDTSIEVLFWPEPIDGKLALSLILVLIALCVFFIIRQLTTRRNRRRANTLLILALTGSILNIYAVNYAFHNVLGNHQKERIDISLGLIEDPDGKGYNINRAMAAIGSGGFSGKGYMKSTLANAGQKHVPMQSTDFIFCPLSEEWGFIGSTLVIVLFMLLLIRIIFIAERQRSQFSRIYAYCVAGIFFFHFLINIGMAIGIAPVIGIPLPFFSYGGSSMFAFSMLLFILLRLDAERLYVLR